MPSPCCQANPEGLACCADGAEADTGWPPPAALMLASKARRGQGRQPWYEEVCVEGARAAAKVWGEGGARKWGHGVGAAAKLWVRGVRRRIGAAAKVWRTGKVLTAEVGNATACVHWDCIGCF